MFISAYCIFVTKICEFLVLNVANLTHSCFDYLLNLEMSTRFT